MAKTVKKPIKIVRAVTQVCGWQVLNYQESKDVGGIPTSMILVKVFQDAERSYGSYWLRAADDGNSLCLFVNSAPTSMDDQLLTGYRGLKGAFSAVSAAHREAGGDASDKLAAVEQILVSSGLLDQAFA